MIMYHIYIIICNILLLVRDIMYILHASNKAWLQTSEFGPKNLRTLSPHRHHNEVELEAEAEGDAQPASILTRMCTHTHT